MLYRLSIILLMSLMIQTAENKIVLSKQLSAETLGQKIIQPFPGGQTDYFTRIEFEVLFGGAAGPGKSWCLVIDALGLQYEATPLGRKAIEVPHYRGVLFRRESTQLSKLLDEAHEYYPDYDGIYTTQRRGDPGPCYTFPDLTPGSTKEGAKIFLCHLKDEADKRNHKGIEYQFAGFDELTEFTLTQYLYLISRLRSTIPYLTPRLRATSNPEGPGLWWVKERFIDNMQPRKTYFFINDEDMEMNPQGIRVSQDHEQALSRSYVPGKLDENLVLATDPEYKKRIYALGGKYAKALLFSDWDAFSGDFFEQFDNTTMMIDPFEIPEEWALYGSLDPGFASPCSFGLRAMDFEGSLYRIATYYVKKSSPSEHAVGIKAFIENCIYTGGRMPYMIAAGLDAWAKKDRYAIMANEKTFADVFLDHGIYLTRAVTDRIPGWWAMKDLMKRGKYFVFKTTNVPFTKELSSATHDEHDPEDIAGRGNDPNILDHALDEDRYGVMAVYKPMQVRKVDIHPGTRAAVHLVRKKLSKWTKL